MFPQVNLRGCFSHLCQNIFKKVQANNLRNIYNDPNDDTFRINIRMISALAFVPLNFIVWAFERLYQHCGNAEQPILQYFESNYIGEMRAGVRVAPRFVHTLWNVYDCAIAGLPRTTNTVEGWHNAFQRSVAQSHANIWTFITLEFLHPLRNERIDS